jgi:hypothetical protein
VRNEGSVFQNEISILRIHSGHFENSTVMRYTSNRFLSIMRLCFVSTAVGCIESPKLPPNTEITENVTVITDEMTKITSVYVRLYVSESHTKFHEDWCSFE